MFSMHREDELSRSGISHAQNSDDRERSSGVQTIGLRRVIERCRRDQNSRFGVAKTATLGIVGLIVAKNSRQSCLIQRPAAQHNRTACTTQAKNRSGNKSDISLSSFILSSFLFPLPFLFWRSSNYCLLFSFKYSLFLLFSLLLSLSLFLSAPQ